MKSVSFLNRILNVGKNEWPRIIIAWSLNLFLRAGFVMGWTVTIAMFINRIGVEYLPYLFVLNALMIMMGTIIFSHLLRKISHGVLIFFTTLAAIGLLLLSTLFAYTSDLAFFGILLMAQSILISQLHILITLFTEDLFSPLESQRTFPLVATSETIGGIIGGLLIGILSGFLPAYKFIYLWIIAIFLIVPTLMGAHSFSKKVPSIRVQKQENKKKTRRQLAIPNLLKGCKKIRKIPFLQGVLIIVMLQFMMMYLFEYQYTKAIQEEVVSQHNPIAFEVTGYQPETSLQVSLIDVKAVGTEAAAVPAVAAGHEMTLENELTQKLGMLQVIFSAGSLLVQIFVTSRILNSLGIVSTLLLHPLLTLINLVGMTVNFNFLSASIGRSGFEITTGIFRNAYHSSYYAIAESMRDQIKELMEGFIKPFGAILAFGLLYVLQTFHKAGTETIAINLCMILIAALMSLRIYRLHKQYTAISYRNLGSDQEIHTRINAIEILGQKGHQIESALLVKFLNNAKEKTEIKRRILETLSLRQEPQTIPDILNVLEDKHPTVRLAAIEALNNFKNLKQSLRKQTFTKHHAKQTIKNLFLNETSSSVRTGCIQLLAKFDDHELIPFLISVLQEGDETVQRAAIRACGSFKDRSITHYITEYLDHKNHTLRGEAIVTLWQFKKLRKTLKHYLDQIKASKKKNSILAAIYTIGKIKIKKDLPYLIKHLASSDQEVRKKAAYSIGQLNHPAAIPHLVEFMIKEEHESAHRTRKFIRTLSSGLVESVEHLAHIRISEYINDILEEAKAESLFDLDIPTLEKLKQAYSMVDEHHEVYKIEQLIKTKQKGQPNKEPAYENCS